MFTCGNCHGQHETAEQAKICYAGGVAVDTKPRGLELWQREVWIPAIEQNVVFGDRRHPDGPLSLPQFNYIRDLHGDPRHAATLTYEQAHKYINELKNPDRKVPVEVTAIVEPPRPEPDRKEAMIEGLLSLVADGYYATQEEEGKPVTFIRLSTPVRGKFAGTRKIQTVHGSGYGSARLDLAACRWPRSFAPGYYWKWYDYTIKDALLLLCADHLGCALRYSEKIGKCARCNATLTDERSRWYGIGPECEKYWPSHMEEVRVRKGDWHPGAVA